jgi:protease I
MTRSVILVESGFQDEEFVYPYYRMLEEGWQVDIASPDGAPRSGKFGVPARSNRVIWDLAVERYDACIIPGGFECPDRLRVNEPTIAFVRAMHATGKLVAAICHGPWVLISAGLCPGRRMTGYKSIKPDLVNAGAMFEEWPVVVDGNIVTAPHYQNNGDFMKAVIASFHREQFTEGAHAI